MHHQVYHHFRRRHHSVFSDNLAVGEDRCPLTSGPRHERTRARAISRSRQARVASFATRCIYPVVLHDHQYQGASITVSRHSLVEV